MIEIFILKAFFLTINHRVYFAGPEHQWQDTTYTHKMNLVILGVSICFANQLELERVFACKV